MKDTFTLEEIEAAYRSQWSHIDEGEPLEPYEQGILDDLKSRLTRPQPEFEAGQVVFHPYMEDDQPTGEYAQWEEVDGYHKGMRPLTLTEAGPAYRKLVEALEEIDTFTDSAACGDSKIINDMSKPALAAFRKAVPEDV